MAFHVVDDLKTDVQVQCRKTEVSGDTYLVIYTSMCEKDYQMAVPFNYVVIVHL